MKAADDIRHHRFDLLGSGVYDWGDPIDWQRDPTSGYRWAKRFYAELLPAYKLTRDADVKLPWELSRMHHLVTLAKAYRLTTQESYAQELVAQINHWLDDNPCQMGVNWTSAMDVAIRLVNIIWATNFLEGTPFLTISFKRRLLATVWEHAQYLVRHLEFSVRKDGQVSNNNHYLANIVGLLYGGILFPEFKAAKTWLDISVEALVAEMEQQVHADGVDYESSTSYHRLKVELFTSAALLCRLNGISLPQEFWAKLEKMYCVTLYLTRPDGKMPQVGDADDGRLHILSDYATWDKMDHRYLLAIGAVLFNRGDMKASSGGFSEEAFWLLGCEGAKIFDALAGQPGSLTSKAFRDAGLYVMRSGESYLLACCNAVGTAGTGNHKHNDVLSFELCAEGRPYIVDPGAFIYTAKPEWRNLFRSTRYHNTVVIDRHEQNRFEFDKLFQMTPDAEPIIHQWFSNADSDFLDVEHTGYRRLTHPVSHRRKIQFNKYMLTWQITDMLHAEGYHLAEWYFHLDPQVEVNYARDHVYLAYCRGPTLLIHVSSRYRLPIQILDGWISPSYGVKCPAKILKLSATFSTHLTVEFKIAIRTS